MWIDSLDRCFKLVWYLQINVRSLNTKLNFFRTIAVARGRTTNYYVKNISNFLSFPELSSKLWSSVLILFFPQDCSNPDFLLRFNIFYFLSMISFQHLFISYCLSSHVIFFILVQTHILQTSNFLFSSSRIADFFAPNDTFLTKHFFSLLLSFFFSQVHTVAFYCC